LTLPSVENRSFQPKDFCSHHF